MAGHLVGYVRVSSPSQNLDRQLHAIGEVEELFTDHFSGARRGDRAGLADALRRLRRGDTLRVSSMDRFARSLVDLEQLVDELTGRGVIVEFLKERLTFAPGANDPFATFQRQLIGAVAELERSLIHERQREGIELAKQRGVYKGRARALTDAQVRHARRAAAAGEAKAKIARDLGCSSSVLYNALSGRGAYESAARRPARVLTGSAEAVELPLEPTSKGRTVDSPVTESNSPKGNW